VENKEQYNTSTEGNGGVHTAPSQLDVVKIPDSANALSLETPAEYTAPATGSTPQIHRDFIRFAKRFFVIAAGLLLIAGAVTVFVLTKNQQADKNKPVANRFDSVKLSLNDLLVGQDLALASPALVTINGTMQLNNGLLVTPTLQPTGAKPGQIYYDQGTNQLAYFNGSNFVFLTGPEQTPGGVQSLGGATGQLTLGDGLSLSGTNQLANSGVISVQGKNGDVTFTAGPGLVINGTTFSNSGVLSVASGSPNVTVGDDGAGGVTISVAEPVMGTGTVQSSGGTPGHIPLFTANQNIEDSIVTQSGLTVTISGDLSVVTGGLSLSNALTVSNGGTGANSLALNGILVGQGTGPISSVTSGAAGLCLLSTSGMPTWGVCPGGSGVTTLNGLAGALNIANASAAGSTITIDNASTTNKGIASFNGTNFTASGGAVNTVQDINATATPTFAGVNTNTVTPNAALTLGISAQTALLQGSTTTITSNGVGNNIVLNSAGTIELQDTTNVTGNLNTSGDLAVNGGDITSSAALNITPGGTLTVGSASQTLTLQGGASTSFRATSGGNNTVVGFTNPVANTTLNFPALAAGTYTICTTSGNCAGAATTLQGAYDNSSSPEIVLDATRGGLTLRDNTSPISGNLLEVQNNTGSATYLAVTSSGVAITGTATVSGNINTSNGSLQTNGTARIDNSGNAINLGNLTLSGAISGGTTITSSGNINTSTGSLQTGGTTRIDNGGNLINIASVTASGNATFQGGSATLGTNSQAGTIALNDGSSNTGTLQVAALGQNTTYTLPDPGGTSATICLSTGNCAGSAGGVTTGGGTTNKLAKFNGTQTITDSSITDDGTNVTVAVDVIVQGGDLTVGSTSQPASVVLHDGNGQTTTLQAGDSAGNLTFVLPTNTGVANQCLKQSGTGNQLVWQDCDGGSSGSSATLQTAYNNSTNPEITLNSSVGGLTLRDNSTPVGGNLFEIQNNLGSTTYLAVTATGTSANGTVSATGNINSSGGSLQTNGTARIDNSGNVVNIGNITSSGAMTIASIGAGNDITIDGADQFIVQDASVFNALTTFNANLDIGSHDIIGTTGNISLTNFGVAGATGDVTAGTYNGQTISNAANFTGSVTAAGTITTSGDIAVNGGDLTSVGALNITPGGTLTVGATGQQLILQGSANTKLTAAGGGFTTTVGFNGSPVGNITYNFDRAAAAGTYTICTTIGNCAGTGGGVTTPGGTTGTIAVFTGSQTLGDSLLSQTGGTVTVSGNLNLSAGSQYRINGTQISSADLSNDANLAKLSASQTFTGNTVAFQNGTNSTNAFNVQNAGGNQIMTVDTADGQVILGQASTLNGQLVFMNVSNGNKVTIQPGTLSGNRTLTLPDVSGIICTDSGNCAGAGSTLQTAYNFSVGGTTPKIKVNSTLGGFDIQDADTPIGANLLNIRSSNGAGLGSVIFGVGNTGQVSLQNSANSTAAFRLLTQGGTSVLTGDTTNGQVLLGQSNTLDGTLVFRNASSANVITLTAPAASAGRSIVLPDASGTVCLSIGNCSGSGSSNTLQAAYDAGNTITTTTGRDVSFAMADSATDSNFLVNLQCTTGCGSNGRFAIQQSGTDVFTVAPVNGAALFKNTVNATTAFQIQNAAGSTTVLDADTTNGRIGIGTNAPAYTLDVAGDINTSAVYRIGGTSICTSSGCTAASGSNFYVQLQGTTPGSAQTGNFNITGTGIAGTLQATTVYAGTVDAVSAGGTLALGAGNSGTGAVTVAAGATTGTVTIGGSSQTGTITLGNSTATNTVNIGTAIGNGNTQTINIGGTTTGSNTNVTLGSGTGSSSLTLQSGTGAINIGTNSVGHIINIGNTTSGTQVLVSCGSTACSFGADGASHPTTVGSTATGVTTTLQAGGTVAIQTNSSTGGTLVKSLTNSTTAFQVQDAAGTSNLLVADTVNNRVGIGTNTPAYKLDVVGDINSSTAIRVGGTQVCTASGCTPNGSFVQLQSSTPGTPQTGNLNISGTGIAGTALQSPLVYGNTFDSISGTTTLNIGTTNATSGINLNQNVTLASGKTLTVQGTSSFKTGTDSTTALQVLNSGNGKVFVVDTANNFVRVVQGSITNITTASGTGALQIGADNTDNLAFDDNEIMARTNGSASGLYLQKLGGTLNIQASNTTIKPNSDSTNAFRVQNAGATATALNVDTTNTRVGIGTAAPSSTLHVAVNNTQNTIPMMLLDQAGTGDATIAFKNPTNSFYVGQDTSNSSFTVSSSIGSATSVTPTYVQSGTATNDAAGTNLAASLPTSTTGNLIAVTVSWDTNASSTYSCADTQGNTYTIAVTRIDATSKQAVGVCYAPNIIGGADTITVTFGGGSPIFRRVVVSEYSGIATSSPVDVTTSNVAAGTTAANGVTSGSATTTQAGDLIYGSVNDTASTTTITAGTGFTQRASVNGADTASQDQVQASSGSIASTQTFGAAHRYIATLVAFKAASTGSSDTFASSLFNLTQTGATTFRNASNSSAAFRIQTAGGANLFNIDSSSNLVSIGTGSTSGPTPTLLVLSSKNSSADPTGAAGAMYYNASLGKFRCYEGGAWKNCITSPADLARYRADGTQVVATSTNTKLTFSQFDSLSSYVNISGGNDTFTLLKAGIWSITANARFANSSGASGERYIAVMDGAGNLVTGNRYAQNATFPGGGLSGSVSVSTTRRFNANDTISVLGYQTSGANSTIDGTWGGSNVSMTFLGD
jgi:hypothetical protein